MGETPVACTMGSHDMKTREEEWRSLLVSIVIDRSLVAGGVQLVLKNSADTRQELERLIALEKSCCAWIHWQVRDKSPSLLLVEATAEQEEGEALLREWFSPQSRATPTSAGAI